MRGEKVIRVIARIFHSMEALMGVPKRRDPAPTDKKRRETDAESA